jgi:hypothetical protein
MACGRARRIKFEEVHHESGDGDREKFDSRTVTRMEARER